MNTPDQVMELLTEWRRLTERETCAILAADWKSLAAQQGRKGELMQAIIEVKELARSAGAGNTTSTGTEGGSLQSIVSDLVTLETRNRDLLSTCRENARDELQNSRGVARTLHGVRRAYGRGSQQQWHSYS